MLKENLERAQARMKKNADLNRSERQFKVGDWVYMKLQPYRHVSLSGQMQSKLNPKYYGPCKIVERIGSVAYKLNLPPGSSIHPVLHVSQLKLRLGEGQRITPQLPIVGPNEELRIEPYKVLNRRVIKRNNAPLPQLLIHWVNQPEESATWEDYDWLIKMYPQFILEDKHELVKGVMSQTNRAESLVLTERLTAERVTQEEGVLTGVKGVRLSSGTSDIGEVREMSNIVVYEAMTGGDRVK